MAFPVVGTILGWLGSEVTKRLAWDTVKWVGQKALIISLCLGLGPVVLFKGFSVVTRYMMEYAGGKIQGEEIPSITVQFIGLGGWIASAIRLPEAFSIFLSFCLLSFSLRMIRVK